MTTKLDKPITRETTQRLKGRPVLITIAPATAADYAAGKAAQPEHVSVRLKGTQQVLTVPMDRLLRWMQLQQQ